MEDEAREETAVDVDVGIENGCLKIIIRTKVRGERERTERKTIREKESRNE